MHIVVVSTRRDDSHEASTITGLPLIDLDSKKDLWEQEIKVTEPSVFNKDWIVNQVENYSAISVFSSTVIDKFEQLESHNLPTLRNSIFITTHDIKSVNFDLLRSFKMNVYIIVKSWGNKRFLKLVKALGSMPADMPRLQMKLRVGLNRPSNFSYKPASTQKIKKDPDELRFWMSD